MKKAKKGRVSTKATLAKDARRSALLAQADNRAATGAQADLLILRTKLHRPPLAPDFVPRSDIVARLEEFRTRPLTLVSASAGYGKSTLASLWLEACDAPSAWLSLDEDDNDLRVFLAYFVAAVRSVFPDACQSTRALVEAPNLPPASVLGRYLLNDLDEIEERLILVLDDYHKIEETAVHDLLSAMLAHPSPMMHLMLLTRRDPPLPIGTLRGHGHVNEVTISDLRFTPEETAVFLQNVLALRVDEQTAVAIDEKLEGWAAGMRLMAQSLRQSTDVERLLASLQGGFASIVDYLVSEVLSRQSPAVADYLIETSILDRFCVPLCESLRGSGAGDITAEEFIVGLQRENLFLIALDTENRWFRYHHLFQQLLQNHLRCSRTAEDIATLHFRASEWFGENGLVDDAIRHALVAGDVNGATHLVEQNRQAMLNEDRWYVFEKWLSMFSESVIQQQPALLMTRAWVLYHHFAIQSIPAVLDTVESLLSDASTEPSLRGEIDFFRGYILYFQSEGALSLKHLQDALARLPATYHEIRGQTEILLGLASQMQGEGKAALERLNSLLSKQESQRVGTTRLFVTPVYIHIIAGDLDAALAANEQLHEFAKKMAYAYARVWSVYLRGLICFFKNDIGEAVEQFSQVIENRHISHTRAVVDSMGGLAFSCQATGQTDRAHAAMQQLFEYVESLSDPAYSMVAHSCRARLSMMQGALEPVTAWSRQSLPPVENMVWWLEIPAVTHCRALLAEGSAENLERAEANLEELLQLNERNHNTLHTIHVLSLLALGQQGRGSVNEALTTLGRAVSLAEPGGVIRPFVDPGAPMAELLNLLVEQKGSSDFTNRLLSAFRYAQRPRTPKVSESHTVRERPPSPQPPVAPLTNREVDVLELLGGRHQNKEIAAKLSISSETVKTHVQNICQKLSVGNRRDAVAKAGALGIISRH